MIPLLVVLTPFLLIILFVAVKMKHYLDEYIPRRVIVRHEGDGTVLFVETKKKNIRITVKDFRRAQPNEVLEVRVNGLAFGRYRLGEYRGAYGYVESYAISNSGLLIEDADGKRYYLAFDNIHEAVDAMMDDNKKEKVIEVRRFHHSK
ncbi:hypothetical protein [Thermococcus sp.]|uniref:hypothetical protein n=1 Tax=Thermococcus sp. TaxID=35749 RepID=UPI002629A679|nr:hypothetical protein [Thermococcus sp.]